MTRLSVFLFALVMGVGGAAQDRSPAVADFTRTELHLLRTTTLSDEQFLTGVREGTPGTTAAELRLPVAARFDQLLEYRAELLTKMALGSPEFAAAMAAPQKDYDIEPLGPARDGLDELP